MSTLSVPSCLDIFGDVESAEYYSRCKEQLETDTGQCAVKFIGGIDKKALFQTLSDYDVLLHPTLGENFGHAIVESLHLGLPVLISDQSPWNDVHSTNAGWSLPLSDMQAFVDRLETIYAMGTEWCDLSVGALRYAKTTFNREVTSQKYRAAYG